MVLIAYVEWSENQIEKQHIAVFCFFSFYVNESFYVDRV